MKKQILGLVLLSVDVLAGCGSSDGGAAVQCAQTDRMGTYVFHYVERPGGTCGMILDAVVRLDASAAATSSCTNDVPNTVSADQCKVTTTVNCPVPSNGGHITTTTITVETESGGGMLSGVSTLIGYDATGSVGCISTYDLTATRQ